MVNDNLIIPGDVNQEIPVSFASEVRASPAAHTIRVESGTQVTVQAADSDGVRVPGALSAYEVSASGNELILERERAASSLSSAKTRSPSADPHRMVWGPYARAGRGSSDLAPCFACDRVLGPTPPHHRSRAGEPRREWRWG